MCVNENSFTVNLVALKHRLCGHRAKWKEVRGEEIWHFSIVQMLCCGQRLAPRRNIFKLMVWCRHNGQRDENTLNSSWHVITERNWNVSCEVRGSLPLLSEFMTVQRFQLASVCDHGNHTNYSRGNNTGDGLPGIWYMVTTWQWPQTHTLKKFVKEKKVKGLTWPSLSPDSNPTAKHWIRIE